MSGSWLVTGGAGYIGAHVVSALSERGDSVVVVDDLSTGAPELVRDAPLVVGSILDDALLRRVFRDHDVQGVVHIAAKKQVGESVTQPLYYYRENVRGTLALLEAAAAHRVESFVFSSSAAVYGMPDEASVTEDTPTEPLSPYGETKLACEWMCRAVAAATPMQVLLLRYFNVAGAKTAELTDRGVFNLIPIALRALTSGEAPRIFGDDYPTPDGTCVRDFVHVSDVADAHCAAVSYLRAGGASATYNIGRGVGASVREVLATIAEVTGLMTAPVVVDRRPGDPARIVAATDRITRDLGWIARHDLREMVEDAWRGWADRP